MDTKITPDIKEIIDKEVGLRIKELESQKESFEILFEDNSDGLLLIQDFKFIKCNKAIVKMLNYKSKEQFLNTHPSKLSPEYQPCGKTSFEKLMR